MSHCLVFLPVVGSLKTGLDFSSLLMGLDGQTSLHGAISAVLAAAFTLKVPRGHTLGRTSTFLPPWMEDLFSVRPRVPALPKEAHSFAGSNTPMKGV